MGLSVVLPASAHLFERGGFFVLLDVPSGSVFSLGEEAYVYLKVLMDKPDASRQELQVATGFSREVIQDIEQEFESLISSGCLFNATEQPIEDSSALTLKSLCLNVAHVCNFSCSYCFAHGGDYHDTTALMSKDIALASIDFLVRKSAEHSHVEVDFFGGEPLMNWPVIIETMQYACAAYPEKMWRFTLTTNGSLLREDMFPILEQYDVSVVLSLDGGRVTNDANRVFKDARGTFDTVVQRLRQFTTTREDGGYFVRGTYARNTLRFSQSVRELHEEGFRFISMEPVVLSADSAIALRDNDLPAIRSEYEALISYFISELHAGTGFEFFHFKVDLAAGPCVSKRIYGCGAGVEYLAIAPDGGIFPCHQFDGLEQYKMGNVLENPSIRRPDLSATFAHANFLYAKDECRACWARFYCSGGCLANNVAINGSLVKPYALGCAIQKERIEAALAVKAAELPGGD